MTGNEANVTRLESRGQIYKRLLVLAIAGGLAFWVTNFGISRTPVAAEYRAALSISYLPMIVESLVGGLVIGIFVSFFLVRFFDKIPTRNPILKSVILCFIVLIIASVMEVPGTFLTNMTNPLRYFLIGELINALRILALGILIGYLYRRLNKGLSPFATASKSPLMQSPHLE